MKMLPLMVPDRCFGAEVLAKDGSGASPAARVGPPHIAAIGTDSQQS